MRGFRKTLALAAAFAVTTAFVLPAHAASLADEIGGLLNDHPRLAYAQSSIDAHQSAIDQADSEYLPTVTVSGEYGYEITTNPSLRAASRAPWDSDVTKAEITVVQKVFDGYAREGRNARATINKTLSEIALTSAQQTLLYDGTAAYLNVLRHQRREAIATENEKVVQKGLRLENARVERGSGIEVDVLTAKARLQVATEKRVVFASESQKAMTRFAQIFAHMPKSAAMTVPAVPNDAVPGNLEDAVAEALRDTPLMQDRLHAVQLAQQDVRISKSGFYPRLDVVAKAGYENDFDATESWSRDASVRLRMSWDIFSGFATTAGESEAKHRLRATEMDRAYVQRQVIEDVKLAWESLETARERTALFQNAVTIANEIRDVRKKLVDAGKETALNLVDAESEVFNARIEAIDAEFDTYVAVYRLLLATGKVGPALYAAK